MIRWTIPILILALAAPASAQQWQVARDQFAFAGRQLTVHVDVDGEGTLRVIRGSSGLVRVSGLADGGMTAAGLTSNKHLTLTGSGPGPVEFVIAVPDRVRLNIHLPDRPMVVPVAGHDRSRSVQWGPSAQPQPTPAPAWAPEPDRGLGDGSGFTVFAAPRAPKTVALPDLRNVRSVTVRIEGSAFRIGASRPLTLARGNPDDLEIRPAGPPMELIVVVPAGTDRFTLYTAGAEAMVLEDGQAAVLCSPNTRQWLSGGRGWVTFTPVDGTLRCDGHTQRIRLET